MIKVANLHRDFDTGVSALANVNFLIKKGEFVSIIGPSGSGKSTLLRCINRLVTPSVGEIFFHGRDICKMKRSVLRDLRRSIGMVFQQFNLIPRQSVLKNVLYGSLGNIGTLRSLFHLFGQRDITLAFHNLNLLGLSGKEYVRVDQLSGGEQQRVAIARTLMQSPVLILADEPIASLDPVASETVMMHLQKLNQERKITIIATVHSIDIVKKYSTRVLGLREGSLIFDGSVADMDDAVVKSIYDKDIYEDS